MKKHNPEVRVFKNCLDFLPANPDKWMLSLQIQTKGVFGALNRELTGRVAALHQ